MRATKLHLQHPKHHTQTPSYSLPTTQIPAHTSNQNPFPQIHHPTPDLLSDPPNPSPTDPKHPKSNRTTEKPYTHLKHQLPSHNNPRDVSSNRLLLRPVRGAATADYTVQREGSNGRRE
ncbi:hypothetical protein NMY22_g12752 [Coprinellus aureogranulatus]|nr:hypothetical protein NMY22_g12752 [Coprinellus aureogranulatus]